MRIITIPDKYFKATEEPTNTQLALVDHICKKYHLDKETIPYTKYDYMMFIDHWGE